MIEKAVLEAMSEGSRSFQTGKGSFAAFSVKFADGRTGEVTTKADTLDRRRQEYQGLIGKPAEFEFIDQGTWPDNSPKPWKIKRPQQGGGGSGGGGQAAYRNTQEGQTYEQEAMDRRTGLMQAVAVLASGASGFDMSAVRIIAGEMYTWLRETKISGEPRTQPTQGAPPPSSSVPAERQSPDPSKYQGTPTQPSGDEAQRDTGAPTHGEGTSPETVQESGDHLVNGEVANTPAPGAVTELGAEGAKALAAALGGQKFALDLARDEYGPDVTSLRKLTMAQGAQLLEIKGVSA